MTLSATLLLIPATVFLVLLVLERVAPLRRRTADSAYRLGVNLLCSLLTYLVAYLLVSPASAHMLSLTSSASLGLLHWLPLGEAGRFAAGILLLDLSFYYWHRLNHRSRFLWRFHNVHHFDPDLDVTTGFRFHPGEVAFSTLFRVVQVLCIGPGLGCFLVYQAALQTGTFLHHSNVRLPPGLERLLNVVIVTPRMHGLHHSLVQAQTDSNYSVVFSFWDRLHRSFTKLSAHDETLRIGVPAYSSPDDNRISFVLSAPFRRQRRYW